MSVDILRVVEYKKNNKWFRLKFKFEQNDEDISTFGFGRNFHECWLENNKINEHVFKHGIPDDSPNKDLYMEYGCLFWYANLDDLKELRENTEHELHTSLKCSVPIDKKIDQILSLLKKEEIERMLYFSDIAAALNTTSFGAIDGLPSLKEVEAKIQESGWFHN